jgi:hypothetical protein
LTGSVAHDDVSEEDAFWGEGYGEGWMGDDGEDGFGCKAQKDSEEEDIDVEVDLETECDREDHKELNEEGDYSREEVMDDSE